MSLLQLLIRVVFCFLSRLRWDSSRATLRSLWTGGEERGVLQKMRMIHWPTWWKWVWLPVGLVFVSCLEPRPLLYATRISYLREIKPIFDQRCATPSCHAAVNPAGQYDLSNYVGALGRGTSLTRNLAPQDLQSLTLRYLDRHDDLHNKLLTAEERTILQRWIRDGLAYRSAGYHEASSWTVPQSKDFHGATIRQDGWLMRSCMECHGEDYKGGKSGTSCFTCHTEGPEACGTCHGRLGAPEPSLDTLRSFGGGREAVGAHRVHLQGGWLGKTWQCEDCHRVPTRLYERQHLNAPNEPIEAEMAFSNFARQRGLQPVWDRKSRTCTQVYCHGVGMSKGTQQTPQWDRKLQVLCGSCHGLPPDKLRSGADHPQEGTCDECHDLVIDKEGRFIRPALHINGTVDLNQ